MVGHILRGPQALTAQQLDNLEQPISATHLLRPRAATARSRSSGAKDADRNAVSSARRDDLMMADLDRPCVNHRAKHLGLRQFVKNLAGCLGRGRITPFSDIDPAAIGSLGKPPAKKAR